MTDQNPPAPHPCPDRDGAPGRGSRRTFLAGAGAGAGALTLGGLALSQTGAAAAARGPSTQSPAQQAVPSGAVVAYIEDASTGRITLLADGDEVLVTDHALAASIARKAR